MFENSTQQAIPNKRDYERYHFGKVELLFEVAKAVAVAGLFAIFFYRSVIAFPILCIPIVWVIKRRQKQCAAKSRMELTTQFKECILSVSSSLGAGYAVENAFVASMSDMEMLFGTNSMIYQELLLIRHGLVLNVPMEDLIQDLGVRSHTDEIQEFAEVFVVAKRSGGNIREVIEQCTRFIRQKVESEEEIQTILASRKFEQMIMNVMPFGILIYIEMANPGYFATLYRNLTGILIMTICMAVYCASYLLSQKIMAKITE
ncbi:MAG: type II secretion system F family protein [Lachnospiraceae bacterium]|jgi:tight adherence protein B|nr:type II secretion system F family protein [Lachnospiraceae bacterium]